MSEKKLVLSEDQEKAFKVMNDMAPGDKVFLTGKAGSGKSTLIEEFCDRYSGVIKLASTGIAAQNIGGRTIHSFMGLRPNQWVVNPSSFKDRLGLNKCVMIDEISMVGQQLFDFIIDMFTEFSEGRIRFLFVGDFCQLPPVEGDFCYTSPHWASVKKLELTHMHRQRDTEFIDVLNLISEGKMRSPEVKALIQDRTVENFPDDTTVVTPRRRVADDYNEDRLKELGGVIHTYEAGILKGEWKDNKIPRNLSFSEGARVLMLTNDPDGEWVNGSSGVITGINELGVGVMLDNGRKIQVYPQEHELLNGAGRPFLIFRQYPFQLGYAITIHKSQGMTMDKIAVDMEGHFTGASMTYVAMSRCRTKEGLYLLGNYYD